MSDSTVLPNDIWKSIGTKLDALSRIRFGAVCKSWTSLLPKTPWLMLAHPKNINLERPPPRRFISVGEQQIYQIECPELYKSRCIGATGNWLVTAHEDEAIRLTNPFSKQQIHLPSNMELYPFRNGNLSNLWKVVLSSSPCDGGDCMAMCIRIGHYALAMARLGDANWTAFRIDDSPNVVVQDLLFYKGQFYVIAAGGKLFVCDTRGDDNDNSVKVTCMPATFALGNPVKPFYLQFNYLVEWLGELLLVVELERPRCSPTHFKIYKFDFTERTWNEMNSLGDYSLFLGTNTSVAVCASKYFELVKRNCIYYLDRFRNVKVFDLEDSSTTVLHMHDRSMIMQSPAVWIVPT